MTTTKTKALYTYEAPDCTRSTLKLSLASARRIFQSQLIFNGGRLVRVKS